MTTFSPVWAPSASSAASGALDPSSTVPLSGCAPASQCVSCQEVPKSDPRTEGTSAVPSTGNGHFPGPAATPVLVQASATVLAHLITPGSYPASSWPASPGLFLLGHSQATLPPACSCAWSGCDPRAGPWHLAPLNLSLWIWHVQILLQSLPAFSATK